MARNKRNETFRPGLVAATLAVCALFVVLSMGYLWYKDQIDILGRQIKERENHLAELERANKMRRDQLATLCSPVALDAMVKQLNLGLKAPDKSQVIWMVDTPVAGPAAGQVSVGQQASVDLVASKN